MKAGTLVSILLGTIAIFGAFFWEGGSFDSLFMLPAMLIVFGGTIAAGVAGSSLQQLKLLPKLMYMAFFPKKYNVEEIIHQIVLFAGLARREGILTLENRLHEVKHPYLAKLIEICIDGADPATLESIFETELFYLNERHNRNISFFNKLGGYSPTMGIIGTVMGLISTLASVGGDPNTLIHHIATAFIATMWGIFMANIVWLPIADKLQMLHNEEVTLLQVMLDGTRGVQLGETPTVIQNRLASALPLGDQKRFKSRKPKVNIEPAATATVVVVEENKPSSEAV